MVTTGHCSSNWLHVGVKVALPSSYFLCVCYRVLLQNDCEDQNEALLSVHYWKISVVWTSPQLGLRYSFQWLILAVVLAAALHVGICIVFTSGGTFKLIWGYSIPVDVPAPMGINYVHNFQFQYPLIDNSSQVSYVQQGARRQRRSFTRKQLYSVIEHLLDESGLDRTCLLRSVCESSAAPFVHSGLIGELFQTILTPYDPKEDSDYSAAWRAGQEGEDCFSRYSQCPHGQTVLDHVSYYM
ncbi:hypothetical protein J6590_035912 [Homalodisca vitripennis]|nr:hypothetical protein J6590_035912 [Homalodisca vitripennis]